MYLFVFVCFCLRVLSRGSADSRRENISNIQIVPSPLGRQARRGSGGRRRGSGERRRGNGGRRRGSGGRRMVAAVTIRRGSGGRRRGSGGRRRG